MGVTTKNLSLLERRKARIRKRIAGTAERPRLRVSRTGKHIYAQVINDENGHVLAAASRPAEGRIGMTPNPSPKGEA